MGAQGIGIFTVDIPNPERRHEPRRTELTIPKHLSFRYPITHNIQTLSSKDSAEDEPSGLLYVPDVRSDACKKAEEEHGILPNTTRLDQLPSSRPYPHVAIAPWFSPDCMKQYFESARKNDLVDAFLVFQPGSSAAMPPPMSDASWLLNDGGSWKKANDFPTFAIMSVSGGIILQQMGLYSGMLSEVPHGDALALELGAEPDDYVRLWASINTDNGNNLPSLWVFLLIVLGMLLVVIFATSSFMHIVQRRRREDLRQRVINGEVNLEALGVKRLTVPQRLVDKLPLYTYMEEHGKSEKAALQVPPPAHASSSSHFDSDLGSRNAPLVRQSSAPSPSAPPKDTSAFSQSTCPICLDDFEAQQTQVRELPCRHIYHPECIDTFLLNNSSLCPMCKESVLPKGHCPVKITNIMVRRERMLSRPRSRSVSENSPVQPRVPSFHPHVSRRPFVALTNRVESAIGGRRVFSAPEHTRLHSRDIDIEMSSGETPSTSFPGQSASAPPAGNLAAATPARNPAAATHDCVDTSSPNHDEWVRQRALALLGNRNIPSDEAEEDRGPRWKNVLHKVFPGFR